MKIYDVIEFFAIVLIASLCSYMIFVIRIVPNAIGTILTVVLSILIYVATRRRRSS